MKYFIHTIISYFLVTCGSFIILSHGHITYSKSELNLGYPVGTGADFTCNQGYSRSGSSSRTCQTSGNWNGKTSSCRQSKMHIVEKKTIIHISKRKMKKMK